jgi:dethiobiotin synthase
MVHQKAFFITGTGTDVGKTLVCAGLLRRMSTFGKGLAVKPVQTGCERIGDDWMIPDLEFWRRASSSLANPPDLYCHVCLKQPASPHLAAAMARVAIDTEDLVAAVMAKLSLYPWAVVEGAGGLMTPITRDFSILDLIVKLQLPAVLVIDNRLGAINNALLSLKALRGAGVPVLGMIFNETAPRTGALEERIRDDNRRTIRELGKVPILADIPFFSEFSSHDFARWEEIDALWQGFPIILHGAGGLQ